MKFNSSARFNRKSFNSEKLFDAGIHDAGNVLNALSEYLTQPLNNDFEIYDPETYEITDWTAGGTDNGVDGSALGGGNPYSGSSSCELKIERSGE